MDIKSTENKEQMQKPIKGIVTARKCECCGHHEIGITTDSGEYISLRPGMIIELFNKVKQGTSETGASIKFQHSDLSLIADSS